MIVSIYKNVTDTEGAKANLFKVLTTDRWRHLSDKVRAEKDKKKRDKLKQQLPAFTTSGIFKDSERTEEGLIKHSGYMCIDIDGDDNPSIGDWQAIVFELGKLPQIAFVGLSVSGNGVFALIPIKYPAKHKEHFKAFQKSFAKRGLVIDTKCGNLSRLRFYSYNEHYYINKKAEPYIHFYKEPIMPTTNYMPTSCHPNESDVDTLVREIIASGINIVPDYNAWFKVASALSNVGNGRELFHRISQVDASKYNYKKCDKQFDVIKPGKGITINTLFYIAKNYGITIKNRDNSNSFADWEKPNETQKEQSETPQKQVHESKPKDEKLDCFVDKNGVLYISTRYSDDTFTVYDSVDQYNSRKGLPSFIDKDQVDTSQMDKQYLNLSTLLISKEI